MNSTKSTALLSGVSLRKSRRNLQEKFNMNWFIELSPLWQAFLATLFTWGMMAAGAGLVFFFRTVRRNVLNGMLGFASVVMIAASYWSLLALPSK